MQAQPENTLFIPAHVPEALVFDFDYVAAPRGLEEPQPALARLLQEKASRGIFYTPRNGGHWIVHDPEMTVRMMRDTELFSSDPAYNVTRQFSPILLPTQVDPPLHGEYRKALGAFFAPGNMHKLEPDIRRIATMLLDEVEPRGGCEFCSEFGEMFPIAVFLSMVGAPMADRHELLEFTRMFTRSADREVRSAGVRGLADYIQKLYAQRRAEGLTGDDVISRILRSDVQGRPLNAEELESLGSLLLLAGLDTVKSVMSFIINYLARHPDQYRRIVDKPALIPGAVEELLRISGVSLPERGLARDADFEGISFKKNERIVYLLPLMSFDAYLNEEPFTVDFDRELSNHLIFGSGIHRCAGSHLARIEIRILLEEWTRRFATFRPDPHQPVIMDGGTVWTPDQVPVVWP